MSRRRARQLVLAGRMLGDLPKVDGQFRAGRLSWSKVRLLMGVTVPSTQEAWIGRARAVSCRELEHEVGHAEKGRLPGRERMALATVRFQVGASLDVLGHEKWERAKARVAMEVGRTVNDAELMLYAAELALGMRRGRGPPRQRSAYHIIVHQCPGCGKAAVQTEDGPELMDRGTTAAIECDAERVDPAQPPGTLDQPTPPGCGKRCWRETGAVAAAVACGGTSWCTTWSFAPGVGRRLPRTW